MIMDERRDGLRPIIRRIVREMGLKSAVLFSLLWLLLTLGDPGSWLVGAPSIGAALFVRRRLMPFAPRVISAVGAARFLVSFLRLSIVSGVDVASRALHPAMPMKPALIDYRLRLQAPADRVLAAGVVSLLPGTLSAALDGDNLKVHVLDVEAPFTRELQAIEDLVAGLHGAGRGSAAIGGKDGHA